MRMKMYIRTQIHDAEVYTCIYIYEGKTVYKNIYLYILYASRVFTCSTGSDTPGN